MQSARWKEIMAERGWLDMYLPRAEYTDYIKKNQESATRRSEGRRDDRIAGGCTVQRHGFTALPAVKPFHSQWTLNRIREGPE